MAGANTDDGDGPMVGELDAKIPIAVSDAEGVPVDELDQTLFDAIDPNALKTLLESDNLHRIVFDFCGYTVTVYGDETIELEKIPET